MLIVALFFIGPFALIVGGIALAVGGRERRGLAALGAGAGAVPGIAVTLSASAVGGGVLYLLGALALGALGYAGGKQMEERRRVRGERRFWERRRARRSRVHGAA